MRISVIEGIRLHNNKYIYDYRIINPATHKRKSYSFQYKKPIFYAKGDKIKVVMGKDGSGNFPFEIIRFRLFNVVSLVLFSVICLMALLRLEYFFVVIVVVALILVINGYLLYGYYMKLIIKNSRPAVGEISELIKDYDADNSVVFYPVISYRPAKGESVSIKSRIRFYFKPKIGAKVKLIYSKDFPIVVTLNSWKKWFSILSLY